MPNQSFTLNNFFLGGIADSAYTGIAGSMAEIVGFDIHSEPGVLKVNQKLVKESGSTVDEEVSKVVVCSDGKSYLFGKSTGKIWSRTSGGVYALEATNANGATLNAIEYNGYVYYASSTKLGRWQLGTAWSTRNDSWATFTNGNASYHPMFIKNIVLYIGDGYLVAQVDDATFTANALDLEKKYIVRSLGEVSNDLLIGAYTSTNVVTTKVFRWNTYSVSFINDDSVPEAGINCFMPTDNFVLVQAGQKGNLYTYNGEQLVQFKRIPGTWTGTNEAFVGSEAAVNYQGLLLFGLSNSSGNPATLGVYSMGSYSSNYPKVLNLEYVISTGNTSNVQITAMAIAGSDVLVAWKDTTSGTVYGVDKIDWSNKFTSPYMSSRVIAIDRMKMKEVRVEIAYRSLPASTTITLQKKVNNGVYTSVTLTKDSSRNMYYTEIDIGGVNTLQLKVGMTVNGNSAPELESIDVLY